MQKTIVKKGKIMTIIKVRRFGCAVGTTMALLYLGCVVVMAISGRQGTVFLFDSLLHGLDVSPIVRMQMPLLEMIMGLIETFILGWLVGATVASFYNYGSSTKCCHE